RAPRGGLTMCGIACAVSLRDGVPAPDVTPALDALAHRGPDGRGAWVSPDRHVAVGHVRLAVRDLAGGAQPLTSEDGRVVAAVNGELYGAAELRARLAARGHAFRARTDSEIV